MRPDPNAWKIACRRFPSSGACRKRLVPQGAQAAQDSHSAAVAEEEARKAAEAEAEAQARAQMSGGFTARLEEINAAEASDARMGGTTMEMIEAGSEYVDQYSTLMNDVYRYVLTLPNADTASLEQSQATWQAEYDQIPKRAEAEVGGGSGIGPYILGYRMELLEPRIRDLISMI